ncbi:hypothetical protein V8C35DRAFT_287915 [Trichoderma chlorosporum]
MGKRGLALCLGLIWLPPLRPGQLLALDVENHGELLKGLQSSAGLEDLRGCLTIFNETLVPAAKQDACGTENTERSRIRCWSSCCAFGGLIKRDCET